MNKYISKYSFKKRNFTVVSLCESKTEGTGTFFKKDHDYLETHVNLTPACLIVMRMNKSVICCATCCAHSQICSDSPEILADMKVRRPQLMEVNYGNKLCGGRWDSTLQICLLWLFDPPLPVASLNKGGMCAVKWASDFVVNYSRIWNGRRAHVWKVFQTTEPEICTSVSLGRVAEVQPGLSHLKWKIHFTIAAKTFGCKWSGGSEVATMELCTRNYTPTPHNTHTPSTSPCHHGSTN